MDVNSQRPVCECVEPTNHDTYRGRLFLFELYVRYVPPPPRRVLRVLRFLRFRKSHLRLESFRLSRDPVFGWRKPARTEFLNEYCPC